MSENHFKLHEDDEPYLRIGRKMGWDLLGICENEVHLAEYLNDRGTLADERWKALKWSRPVNETLPCWWLVVLDKLRRACLDTSLCSFRVQKKIFVA